MTITAAADGSALGNPGPNGWAWYIDESNWAAGGSPHGTNNQGELQAVMELLRATAGVDEPLIIECDSKYVIDSVTKWMPGWKRRGWKKADGKPVLNRELLEGIDEAMRGRHVTFEWVKGHAGHPLNEAADERANGAAKAFQQKREPARGPGFTAGTSVASAAVSELAAAEIAPPELIEPVTAPAPATQALWAEPSDLLADLDAAPAAVGPITLQLSLTADEHARLLDLAEVQGVSVEDALRRLI
ncbi:ribonuclease H [Microbacterium keratanolyticum]|uniref:ribonuclease H family protein n=1 Tax=Microbacterium keratanolyticum TaxID=67574 RepID=UPI00362DFF6A